MQPNPPLESFIIKASVNSALCAPIGGLLDGGPLGAGIGVAAGLALSAAPAASRIAARWLDLLMRGFIVVVGLPVGLAMLATARATVWLFARLSPIRDTLAPFVALGGGAARAMASATTRALAHAGQLLATPLGMANAAAAALIGLELAGAKLSPMFTIMGFGMLILVLLVHEHEQAGISEPDKGDQS